MLIITTEKRNAEKETERLKKKPFKSRCALRSTLVHLHVALIRLHVALVHLHVALAHLCITYVCLPLEQAPRTLILLSQAHLTGAHSHLPALYVRKNARHQAHHQGRMHSQLARRCSNGRTECPLLIHVQRLVIMTLSAIQSSSAAQRNSWPVSSLRTSIPSLMYS